MNVIRLLVGQAFSATVIPWVIPAGLIVTRPARYHDRVARQYDSIYDDPYWHFHDELTWRIDQAAPAARCQRAIAADLGCGTGKWGLKLLKSGFATTFVDHSAAMVEQVREKRRRTGNPRRRRRRFIVADIVEMPAVARRVVHAARGDGRSAVDLLRPRRAAREMSRIIKPGGIVIATADNKLAALDHFVERGNLDALEEFVATGRTQWLTADERERFELTTFTPASLRKLFERAGSRCWRSRASRSSPSARTNNS